jgi:CheY-like chemotaxis protein
MNQETIKKGELNLVADGQGGYICQELVALEAQFNAKCACGYEVEADIQTLLESTGKNLTLRDEDDSEVKKLSDEVKKAKAQEIWQDIVVKAKEKVIGLTPFKAFLFWLSDWCYYNYEFRTKLCRLSYREFFERIDKLVQKHIVNLLPYQVRYYIKDMEAVGVAVGFGHFALLFIDQDAKVRRIITDTQLFELHDVFGYVYLDVTPDGKPIARSRTSRLGERAFFDGIHLMSHEKFQTCAPKTVIIDGGYKVNSTRSTIINGRLYPLIDVDDKVAHTTGANGGWFDPPTFTNKEALESFRLSEESGAKLRLIGHNVHLGEKVIKPFGLFKPSEVKLLDSGFALYEWSEFEPFYYIQYQRILIVDDSNQWISKVREAFDSDAQAFDAVETQDKKTALEQILAKNPEVVLLDMHLTPEEEFDGLWIANKLSDLKFSGKILICSNYPDEYLEAMQQLIRAKVGIPGKKIERLKKILSADLD